MRSRVITLLSILSILLVYTTLKGVQLWPAEPLFASLAAILFFAVMLSGTIIYRSDARVFDKKWFFALAWMGSVMFGFWATFVMISLPFDFVHLLTSGFDWAKMGDLDHAEKVRTLFRNLSWVVLGLSALLALAGFLVVMIGPKIKRIGVKVPKLPRALQDFKIAQISDLHVGPTVRKSYVKEVVRRANAETPDLIVITGDLADAHESSITEHLALLAGLKSRYGIYYVTGNHEYYWNALDFVNKTRSLGFTPLINENRVVEVGDAKIMVAGVTDPMGAHLLTGHAPDMKKAVASDQTPDFKILLAHRPDASIEAGQLGFDLQFSGHTHAGQFFPFSLFIGFAHRYSRGLYRHEKMWVYVNPGTGYWGPANRLGVSPEITIVTLKNDPS